MRILSVNIEGFRHLDAVSALLDEYDPDVACVQELFAGDSALLEDRFTHVARFDMSIQSWDGRPADVQQVVLASKRPFEPLIVRYAGPDAPVQYERFDESTVRRGIVAGSFGGVLVATTHLVVTENAKIEPFQFDDVDAILRILEPYERVLLCGDFNATRGGSVYDRLADRLADRIPPDADTTLDPEMHKARPKKLVVDGCFTRNVEARCELRFGVSDHAALLIETSE